MCDRSPVNIVMIELQFVQDGRIFADSFHCQHQAKLKTALEVLKRSNVGNLVVTGKQLIKVLFVLVG